MLRQKLQEGRELRILEESGSRIVQSQLANMRRGDFSRSVLGRAASPAYGAGRHGGTKPSKITVDGLRVYFALAHASLDGGLSPPLLTAVTW